MTKIKLSEVAALVEKTSSDPGMPERLFGLTLARAQAKSIQTVGGFSFDDQEWVKEQIEDARAKRRAAVQNFEVVKTKLKMQLAEHDIKPLAMVPAEYWDQIVRVHDLVTLKPSLTGEVYVNNSLAYSISADIKTTMAKIGASLITGGLMALAGVIIVQVTKVATFRQFVSALAVDPVFWSLIGGLSISLFVSHRITNFLIHRQLQAWLNKHSRADLLRAIAVSDDYNTHTKTKLTLPEPPLEVIQLLRKLRKANWAFEVTAETAAIQLDPSIEDLFHAGHDAMEREIAEAMDRDPIIAVRLDGVVAVLAQFGDFEWEKAVVEDVIWSRPLPT